MSRSWNSYFWFGTDVLRNKLDLRDQSALSRAEYAVTSLRSKQLLAHPGLAPASDPLERIQQIHAHLFQDVYDWAGEIRSVDLVKNGHRFAQHHQIAPQLRHGFQLLKVDSLDGAKPGRTAKQLAQGFGWINQAHPFREGNGRATRLLLRIALREHGLDLDSSQIQPADWNQRSALSAPRKNWFGVVTTSPNEMRPLFSKMLTTKLGIIAPPESEIQRLIESHRPGPALGRSTQTTAPSASQPTTLAQMSLADHYQQQHAQTKKRADRRPPFASSHYPIAQSLDDPEPGA